ncbi:MAG: CYTH domain-containing protein [Bacteroidetes bacterium]|jgi:hypothetical protein|nr:CYTH domain-containing protein [Bacteroidota bacterium]
MFENLLPDKASEAIYSATKYSGQICQPILMFLILFSFSRAVAQEAPGRGIDALRIENEVKLSVPEALSDSVWNYLLQTYLDGTPDFLRNHIPPFSYQVATDSFVDQYYDTQRFSLLQLRSGARYRQRFSLSGAGGEKDGRELIQLKMDSEGSNALSRGEYKYDVEHYQKAEEPLDYLPFMGRVKRGQRDKLISRLKEYGINPESLSPTIRITQIRRRLYFFTGDRPFSTLTLDAVTADYQGKGTHFHELELELNEIRYTESQASEREAMEAVNNLVQEDILRRFPGIVQDQTPKYNKAATAIGISAGASNTRYYLLGLIGLLLAGFLFWWLRTSRR